MILITDSNEGKIAYSVCEIIPANSMIPKNPVTMPDIYLSDLRYPYNTPIDELVILLGPGVNVVMITNVKNEPRLIVSIMSIQENDVRKLRIREVTPIVL